MKPFATLLLLLISAISIGQNPLTYTQVVEVDSVSKDVLFERALTWFTQHTTGSKAIMLTKDKETGELSAKMSIPYHSAYKAYAKESKGYIWFTFSVHCKDNKYKYEFTNFTHEGTTNDQDITMGIWSAEIIYEAVSYGLLTKDTVAPKWMADKGGRKWADKAWKELKTGCRAAAMQIVESLHARMETPVAIKKDDW